MCVRVCHRLSAPTYDPSDRPEGDSGGVSPLSKRASTVKTSADLYGPYEEREAKTEGGRGRRSMWNWSRLLSPSIIGDPGLQAPP